MFDVGFSELLLLAIVALVVLGPERLPKVARTAGHLLGRLQRYVSDVKSDINREMQLEELKKLQSQVEDSARSLERSVTAQMQTAETALKETAETVSEAPKEAAAAIESAAADAQQALTPAVAEPVAVEPTPTAAPSTASKA